MLIKTILIIKIEKFDPHAAHSETLIGVLKKKLATEKKSNQKQEEGQEEQQDTRPGILENMIKGSKNKTEDLEKLKSELNDRIQQMRNLKERLGSNKNSKKRKSTGKF